jgi:hypothetical protein
LSASGEAANAAEPENALATRARLRSFRATRTEDVRAPSGSCAIATNVTGDQYYTWISGLAGNGTSGLGFDTASVGEPTFYGVRVRIHFGED